MATGHTLRNLLGDRLDVAEVSVAAAVVRPLRLVVYLRRVRVRVSMHWLPAADDIASDHETHQASNFT